MSGSQRLDRRTESRGSLDVFFAPKSVAVIGATEPAGSVGRTVLSNLLAGQFGGPGTYTVTAACKLTHKDTGKSVAVPSNEITVSIVQRP